MAARQFNWGVTTPKSIYNLPEDRPTMAEWALTYVAGLFSKAAQDGYRGDESEFAEVFFLQLNEPGSADGPFKVDFAAPGIDGQHFLRITTREQLVERIENLKAAGIRPSQTKECRASLLERKAIVT